MAQAPRCPACNYDLSGISESWNSACPLRGACPECGGEFSWGELLRPGPAPPRWSFEHSPKPDLRRACITLVRLGEPLGFWHALRHAPASNPRRVALLFAAAAAIGLLLTAAGAWWFASAHSARLRLADPSLMLRESYLQAREPMIYLVLWLLAGVAGAAPFRRPGHHYTRAAAASALYAGAGLAIAASLLAAVSMLDAQLLVLRGISSDLGAALLALAVLASWAWLLAAWYGAVRWRLPVTRPRIAWLTSQVSASATILIFGYIDARYLPF